MKKLRMKKILAFALPLLLTALSARADLIYQDTFNYSNGLSTVTSTNVVGGVLVTNWLLHSGTADSTINNHRLEVSSTTAYLGVTATRSGDVHRLLSITNNSPYTNAQQVLYASFIVNFTNLPMAAGAYFAHFYVNSSTFQGKLWAFTNGSVLPNTFRLGITAAGATASPNKIYPVDLALNTDYQVVLGYDPVTLDAMTMWINPISSSDFSITTSDNFVPGTNIVNSFAFRQASGFGGFLTVSNLVVSTTFLEAFTNGVASTNALAPKIIYQPIVGITNFPTSSIYLSAVANGQGLGNLTYQWQKSATPDNASPSPVSNPNGNSNVLPFSSAQTTDSGYYSLVVTTPYGLSVTSAVANVSIVDGPNPPVFTSQPASKTIFSGQSATFSTTVIEPPSGGTPVYTWYSNNVVVAAGQTDNGLSSSYAFVNATTNFSATYKVAVTNAYGGIVSTNAVLSVLPIPAVSIAYLRTLVDPTTYQPTNIPATIPYQITGTVTIFTNTTTGNTAGYFLQDGTAGINIFATFGSAFRPAQGDVVTFVGVLSYFSTTGLELFADAVSTDPASTLPYTSYTDTGTTNALPTPTNISFTVTTDLGLSYVNTNLAGALVKLTNVYFGTNVGSTISSAANTAVSVTNANGKTFTVQFFGINQDTGGKTLPAFATSVTGVLYGGNPNFSVAVTKFSDIVVPVNPIPLSFNLSGGNFTFNWTDATFSLQASTNVVGPYITIPGATSGFITNTTAAPTMFFRLYHP
jgi:hypothetical protein